uniref:GDSL esterase/lipase n=1 Tax=Lactuca sativa TaxID=4236 RepID=A0A9R1XRZ8_LACSA|nr:hypothetical protein LSAT_V11C200053890 [Lactuca sativa]
MVYKTTTVFHLHITTTTLPPTTGIVCTRGDRAYQLSLCYTPYLHFIWRHSFFHVMQPVTFMKLTYSSLWLTIIFFSLTFFGDHGGARVTLPQNVVVPAVIAFGDSIVDQGANNNLNTLIKANFSPYGKDFVGGKPTGRFTNNRTPADMIGKASFSIFLMT